MFLLENSDISRIWRNPSWNQIINNVIWQNKNQTNIWPKHRRTITVLTVEPMEWVAWCLLVLERTTSRIQPSFSMTNKGASGNKNWGVEGFKPRRNTVRNQFATFIGVEFLYKCLPSIVNVPHTPSLFLQVMPPPQSFPNTHSISTSDTEPKLRRWIPVL